MSGGLEILGLRYRVGGQGASPGFELRASFSIRPGERAVLQAPSGWGKTTLLRWVAGLEKAEAGQLLLDGVDLSSRPSRERGLGVVFQEATLFPEMSVLENVAYGLKVRGVGREERLARGREALRSAGLSDAEGKQIESLSGGERQRLAFARATVWGPRGLLLDEPFTALDADARAALRAELLRWHEKNPVPVLLITHDEEDSRAIATCRISGDLRQESGVEIRELRRAN